jgi:hypothetical protein
VFECANLGCTSRVSHRGQLCGMCQEQIVDDFDYDDPEDDEEQWECAYPGECLMPGMGHHVSECYTIEDAQEMDGGV